ncbi:MAG: T9SS type A sorting domain-containing protein [Bacteroidia bacterium]|nr:T9SS type A sorting domain-containing protein [Bacteroidia bacterium]
MRKLALTTVIGLFFGVFIFGEIYTDNNGPSAGVAGAPTDQTCARSGCHTGSLNTGTGTTSITSTVPSSGYVPGTTYTISFSVTETGRNKFGFQAMAAFDPIINKQIGNCIITNNTETRLRTNGNGQYVTHRSAGTAGTANAKSWSFDWVAPTQGTGNLVVYAAFNAANGNGSTSGDHIYTDTLHLNEEPLSVEEQAKLNFATVFPTIFDQNLNIQGTMSQGSEIEIVVSDLSGKQIYRMVDPVYTDSFSESISTSTWSSGIYLLQIQAGRRKQSFKVIKY